MDNIRKAVTNDLTRIAEIELFNYRLNFYPIFKSDWFYFKYLTVPALIEKYADEIAENRGKIKSISAEKDFVNILLNPIANERVYLEGADGFDAHSSYYLWEKNKGTIRNGCYSEEVPQSDAMRKIEKVLNIVLDGLSFLPDKLEKKISEIKSVTEMLEEGNTPEQILEIILGEFGVEITDTIETGYRCDCSRERVSRAIATLNRKDMDDLINDGESIEVKCQFCNQAYEFTIEDLKELQKS